MIDVDFFFLEELIGGFTVVTNVMVTIGDVDFLIRTVAAFVGKHKSGDAGEISLKCEDHHVAHETDVFATVAGDTAGNIDAVKHHGFAGCLVIFEAEFDVTNGAEILFDLLCVASAKLGLESPCVFGNEIED